MRFVAIDVETANPDLASICQIGIVSFEGGSVVATWQSLINPEDIFDEWNVSIHGISERDVKDAPIWPDLITDLRGLIEQQIVVCHTSFDRVALSRACEKYGLPGINCVWLDSAKVVRRAWSQFANKGYGLANITEALGIVFQHHVAQEDARAAGEVVLRAIADTGKSLNDWLIQVRHPISYGQIAQQGNPDGSLFGEVVVFTGALSIPRREASKNAADIGCAVAETVNKSTTLLVVGDQDIRRLAGQEKSSKHRKAEELIAKGQSIRILGESDFQRLVGLEEAT
jgi:DNA polymerase-3 subunit epsilon